MSLKKMQHYFSHDLFSFSLSTKRGFSKFFFKWLRIIFLTVHGAYRNRLSLNASALTYYSIMSIVPVLAIAVGISRGFGLYERFRDLVFSRFSEQRQVFVELFKYADLYLEKAGSGAIAAIGLGILFFTAVMLLNNLEETLNRIWQAKEKRSFKRGLADYVAIVLIVPIFFVAASSAIVFAAGILQAGAEHILPEGKLLQFVLLLINLIPYALFWFLFTFIFFFMPNTKVSLFSASFAGFLTALLYILLQWGYIYFQVGAAKYGAIYGSMAALPLFLIWVQLSWILLLIGAQFTEAHMRVDEKEFSYMSEELSYKNKRILALWVLHSTIKKHPLKLSCLYKNFNIPKAVGKKIADLLCRLKMLYETKEGYVPTQIAFEMKISEGIRVIDSLGKEEGFQIEDPGFQRLKRTLDSFEKMIESSSENIRLKDVSDSI